MVAVHRAKIPETGTSMTEEEKVASTDRESGLGGLADIRGSPFRLLRPRHAPSLRRPHDLHKLWSQLQGRLPVWLVELCLSLHGCHLSN